MAKSLEARTQSVIISGLTAAGKTTHSHILSGEFGLQYVSSSQLLLSLLRMHPFQPRDFWITDEANSLWRTAQAHTVDDELIRLEAASTLVVFDTLVMPWLHRCPAFCIWLESTLESRVMKAVVSYQGRGRYSTKEIKHHIQQKDNQARIHFEERYGFDLFSDRAPFDMILDISSCISEPTLCASLQSISQAHSLLRPAVGWYLTRGPSFKSQFQEARASNPNLVLRCPDSLLEPE